MVLAEQTAKYNVLLCQGFEKEGFRCQLRKKSKYKPMAPLPKAKTFY